MALGRSQIWDLTNELWRRRSSTPIPTDYGALLGCCLSDFKRPNGKPDKGLNRLFRILVSESIYMIWKISVIALFFKPSFHLFSQPCSMFTNHGHSLPSQVHLVTHVFWFSHDQLRFIHDYTFLFLSFTYSSFTLFHSRNMDFVSFLRYQIRLLLFDADERYLDLHSILLSSDSDIGVPSRSLMA